MTICQGVRGDILIQSLLTNILTLYWKTNLCHVNIIFLALHFSLSTVLVHLHLLIHVTHGDRKEHGVYLARLGLDSI